MDKKQLDEYLSQYGPEPFDGMLTEEKLAKILKSKKGPIKKILMDPEIDQYMESQLFVHLQLFTDFLYKWIYQNINLNFVIR